MDSTNQPEDDANARERERLDELIGRACDDVLSPEDAELLADALRNAPDRRSAYLEAMGLESLLAAEHEGHPIAELLASDDATSFLNRLTPDRAGEPATLASVLWAERPAVLGALLALAASLLLCTGLVRVWEDSYDIRVAKVVAAPRAMFGQPVGRLDNIAAVRWATPVSATAPVVGGQRLRLLEGVARLHLDGGVDVTLEGPTEVEIVSAMQVRATSGTLRAVANASAEGFVIETPSAQVVQVGPDRGAGDPRTSGVNLQVGDDGVTDVVVYDGQIALQYAREPVLRLANAPTQDVSFRVSRSVRRVGAGEAVRVERSGSLQNLSRGIAGEASESLTDVPVIRSVSDDLRDPQGAPFYRIVPGGFREDARAFVDRFHQWNSLEGAAMPRDLLGADYVQTFNSDKWARDLAITVELDGAASLFVMIDDRVPTPHWLEARFLDTGEDVGLDEGWVDATGQRHGLTRTGRLVAIAAETGHGDADLTADGPGASVDAIYSVWRLDVDSACRVTLGPPGVANERTSMFGVAAVRR